MKKEVVFLALMGLLLQVVGSWLVQEVLSPDAETRRTDFERKQYERLRAKYEPTRAVGSEP